MLGWRTHIRFVVILGSHKTVDDAGFEETPCVLVADQGSKVLCQLNPHPSFLLACERKLVPAWTVSIHGCDSSRTAARSMNG